MLLGKLKLLSPNPCETVEIEAVAEVFSFVFNLSTSVHLTANWLGLFRWQVWS